MSYILILEFLFTLFSFLLLMKLAWTTYRLNRLHALNQSFALYSLCMGTGFLLYGIYHLSLNNVKFILGVMVCSHALYNLGFTFLLLTEFIVQFLHIKQIPKRIWLLLISFFVISTGFYLIFPPTLDMDAFSQGIVDTDTPLITFLIANGFRIFALTFSTVRFRYLVKRSRNERMRKTFRFFAQGNLVFIVGIVLNLLGGLLKENILEIFGLSLVLLTVYLYNFGFSRNKAQLHKFMRNPDFQMLKDFAYSIYHVTLNEKDFNRENKPEFANSNSKVDLF